MKKVGDLLDRGRIIYPYGNARRARRTLDERLNGGRGKFVNSYTGRGNVIVRHRDSPLVMLWSAGEIQSPAFRFFSRQLGL